MNNISLAHILHSLSITGKAKSDMVTIATEFLAEDFDLARKNKTLAFEIQHRHAFFGRFFLDWKANPIREYPVLDKDNNVIGKLNCLTLAASARGNQWVRHIQAHLQLKNPIALTDKHYLLPVYRYENLADRRIFIADVSGFVLSDEYDPMASYDQCFQTTCSGDICQTTIKDDPLLGAFIYTAYPDEDPRTKDTMKAQLTQANTGDAKAYVLYHADSDGRFAGYCAWKALQGLYPDEHVHFHEVQYGQPLPISLEHLSAKDVVYILDFSYSREVLEQIAAKAGRLVVLDHHKSAQKELADLPYAFFDQSKSGALLAWEHFFPGERPPFACVLVNDRDLWKKEYAESRLFEAYLRMEHVGSDWQRWDRLATDREWLELCIAKGQVACNVEDAMIDKVFKSDIHRLINFYIDNRVIRTAVYNCPGLMHSEIAERYYTQLDIDMTMGWRVLDGMIIFSLRSPGRVDVSEVAKVLSGGTGGGHAAAAGFSRTIEAGFSFLTNILK